MRRSDRLLAFVVAILATIAIVLAVIQSKPVDPGVKSASSRAEH